jgi:hypothetical protein
MLVPQEPAETKGLREKPISLVQAILIQKLQTQYVPCLRLERTLPAHGSHIERVGHLLPCSLSGSQQKPRVMEPKFEMN